MELERRKEEIGRKGGGIGGGEGGEVGLEEDSVEGGREEGWEEKGWREERRMGNRKSKRCKKNIIALNNLYKNEGSSIM